VCSQPEYLAGKRLDAYAAHPIAQASMSGWAGAGTDHEAIHLAASGRCAKAQDWPCHFWAKGLRCLGLDEGQAAWPARHDEVDL
jgi:hypothetical protein